MVAIVEQSKSSKPLVHGEDRGHQVQWDSDPVGTPKGLAYGPPLASQKPAESFLDSRRDWREPRMRSAWAGSATFFRCFFPESSRQPMNIRPSWRCSTYAMRTG